MNNKAKASFKNARSKNVPVFYVCVGRLSLSIQGLEFPRGPRVNRWDEKNSGTKLRLGRLSLMSHLND